MKLQCLQPKMQPRHSCGASNRYVSNMHAQRLRPPKHLHTAPCLWASSLAVSQGEQRHKALGMWVEARGAVHACLTSEQLRVSTACRLPYVSKYW